MKCRYLFCKEYNCCLILVVSALYVYEDKLNSLGGEMSFFWCGYIGSQGPDCLA